MHLVHALLLVASAQAAPESLQIPKFSPLGSQVLMASITKDVDYYIARSDGKRLRNLGLKGVRDANWADESTLLLTSGSNEETLVELYDLNTGKRSQVFKGVNCQDVWRTPSGKLVLAHGQFPNIRIATADPSNSTTKDLTPWGFSYGSALSPDGQRVAFNHKTAPGPIKSAIYVINVDGTGLRNLSDGTMSAERPCWSPDGKWIAYQASTRTGNVSDANIYVVSADGATTRKLTTHEGSLLDETPSWSPDGRTIAFQSNRSGKMWVYLMDADGKNVRPFIPLPAGSK